MSHKGKTTAFVVVLVAVAALVVLAAPAVVPVVLPGPVATLVVPAVPAAAAKSAEAAAANVLGLSEALDMARRHGPDFAQARLTARSRELESAVLDARRGPVFTVAGRTKVHPVAGQSLAARIEWDFHDDLSLTGTVDWVWSPSLATGGGDPGELTLSFSRGLWPRVDVELVDRIAALQNHIADLTETLAFVDAYGAVVEAFHSLDQALRAEALAKTRLTLADARVRVAEDRFAAGDLGLKGLQDTRHEQRQALIARRNAATLRARAARNLQRLLGDEAETGSGLELAIDPGTELGIEPWADSEIEPWTELGTEFGVELGIELGTGLSEQFEGGPTFEGAPSLTLHDDLAWEPFVDEVLAALAEAGDDLVAKFLDTDVAYLTAKLAELQALESLNEAKADGGLQWRAEAAYTAAKSNPELTAFVGASWTWSPAGKVSVQQAELALAAAELRSRDVREAARDGAAAMLQSLDDAAFAVEVANLGLAQARAMAELAGRRAELGLAGTVELHEALFDLQRAEAEAAKATAAWHGALLAVARRLGVPLP